MRPFAVQLRPHPGRGSGLKRVFAQRLHAVHTPCTPVSPWPSLLPGGLSRCLSARGPVTPIFPRISPKVQEYLTRDHRFIHIGKNRIFRAQGYPRFRAPAGRLERTLCRLL